MIHAILDLLSCRFFWRRRRVAREVVRSGPPQIRKCLTKKLSQNPVFPLFFR